MVNLLRLPQDYVGECHAFLNLALDGGVLSVSYFGTQWLWSVVGVLSAS
jgi:hypothetical protein